MRCPALILSIALASATLLPGPGPGSAHADTHECGTSGAPCSLTDGEYFAAFPSATELKAGQSLPAVIWLHGYARSGKMMIQNSDYVDPFTDRGYAVIMPSGQPFPVNGNLDWGVADGYQMPRDDIAFLEAVRDDAVQRFNLDPSRILIAGFSRGGSMAWDLACKSPDLAKGFASAAGAFWEPMTEDCEGPVHLFHTHGLRDQVVPFEGRKARFQGIDFHQGNVMKGLDIWREQSGCMSSAENSNGDGSFLKVWPNCENGSIRLELTKAGHEVPVGWRKAVIKWFEGL